MEMAAAGAVHGTAVLAGRQTKGRGRLGKVWQSPPGRGLYTSIILRPELAVEKFPYLTFVAGLAVAEAINSLYGVMPGLKWPNDVYFDMRKCGGILSESSAFTAEKGQRYAVVGVGLNVNTAREEFEDEVAERATSLMIQTGQKRPIDEVFETIHGQLLREVEAFEQMGFLRVIERWRELDCMLGKNLAWVAVDGKAVEGVALGPDDQGRLHIRDKTGCVHEVLSGDIQLAKS